MHKTQYAEWTDTETKARVAAKRGGDQVELTIPAGGLTPDQAMALADALAEAAKLASDKS